MNSGKKSTKFVIIFFFALFFANQRVYSQQFSRQQFYKAMSGKSAEAIDEQLAIVQRNTVTGKDAFEGALLMKKADLAKGKKEKLSLFKSGKLKLETVIAKDTSIAEYRFLRLQIQEHAPNIVKYRNELGSDKQFISSSFQNLSPELQQAILDYSKQSKVLKPADL